MPGSKKAQHRKQLRKNRARQQGVKYSSSREGFLDHHTQEDGPPPKSFVIQQGMPSSAVRRLISNIKKIMQPNTAKKLRSRKTNSVQDFVSVSSEFGVTHLIIVSQKDSGIYLKLGRMPNGPTLTYKIASYSLMNDVARSQKRSMVYNSCFRSAPCLMTNLLPSEPQQHLKLATQMFLNMFPEINPTKQKLSGIRRACLLHYDSEKDLFDLRHYCIRMRPVGVSKGVQKLFKNRAPNLSRMTDISDMILKSELLSETEGEDDERTTVELNKNETKGTLNRAAVRLSEIGPRFTLRLIKIEEGLCRGNKLYEAPILKTEIKKEEDEEIKDETDE